LAVNAFLSCPGSFPSAKTATKGQGSYVGAGLLLWQGNNSFVRFLRDATGESGCRLHVSVEVFKDGMGGYFLGDKEPPNEPTTLRVERRSWKYRFAYSSDGVAWEEIGVGSSKIVVR
jgi:hypothetical protein